MRFFNLLNRSFFLNKDEGGANSGGEGENKEGVKSTNDIIQEAARKLTEAQNAKKDESKKDDGVSKEAKNEKDEKGFKKDDEPSDEEVQEVEAALTLFRALKDPEQRKEIAAKLVKDAGLDEESTEAEKKKATKSVASILKEHLGEDYKFMADKLAAAMEDVIKFNNEQTVEVLRKELEEKSAAEQQAIVEKAYDAVVGEFNEAKELKAEVDKLSSEMAPKKGQGPHEYFRRLFVIAAHEKGITLTKVSAENNRNNTIKNFDEERARKNAKDAISRLSSEGSGEEGKVQPTKQANTVGEAVESAAIRVAKRMGIMK